MDRPDHAATRRSRPRLAGVALCVLVAHLAGFLGHFAAVEHRVSTRTGSLAHADHCGTEHRSSGPYAALSEACDDAHADHACAAWTLLRTRSAAPAGPVLPAPDLAPDGVLCAVAARPSTVVFAFAPKQSPPRPLA